MEKTITTVLPKNHMSKFSDEIDLNNFIQPLLAEKWLVISVTLIIFLISVVYSIVKAPIYQANVLLEVQGDQSSLDKIGSNLLPLNSDESRDVNKQIALIKSRYIIEPVIQNLALDIQIKPNYFPVFGGWYARHHAKSLAIPVFGLTSYSWGGENLKISTLNVLPSDENKQLTLVAEGNNSYNLLGANNVVLIQGTVGKVESNYNPQHPITIQVDTLLANPGTKFYVTKEPVEDIINKISSKLLITDLGANADSDSKTGVLQVSLLDGDPIKAVNILSAIAATAVQRDTEYKSLEAEKTLSFLNQQLPLIKDSLNTAEFKLNRYLAIRGALDLPTASKLLLTQISTDEAQLAQLNILKAQRLQQFMPNHPFIIQLNNQITALQSQIASLKLHASKLPATDQVATNLARDVQVKSQLYLLLLNKIQELQVTKAGTLSDVRILSAAELPEAPQPLAKSVIIACGVLLGLILGCLIVFMRRILHQHVDSPLWIEQQFGIPNFAIIPYSAQQHTNSKLVKSGQLKLVDLLALKNPHELSVEALRSLRTTLHFALQEAPCNIISILGITPHVGKSFISSNIAYILADAGKRVLLIDGDMRRGSIYKYFKFKNNYGLADVINGTVTCAEAINPTSLPTLDFLATGKYPTNPSELLMRPAFSRLLEQVKKDYDIVVIDTVPVLYMTDGMIIGSMSGINLLVVDNATHSQQEIELAFRHMHNSGVKIAGTIFNHTTPKAAKYGYYYNYNYALAK